MAQKITNKARGSRVVNVKGAAGPEAVTLRPGETREDLELLNMDDPVLKGMIESREIVIGEVKELSEEDQVAEDEKRFAENPSFKSDREAAEAAGREADQSKPQARKKQ